MDAIEGEKRNRNYVYSDNDKNTLKKMCDEINSSCGTNIHYLAEIDFYNISGSGSIMVRYLDQFQSESVRCFLIPQLVSDKVDNCADIVYNSYIHFKESDEYISGPGEPAPAHIYVRYDNAFRKLKPKKRKMELAALANNPRDVCYLPFTMNMLASWKIPGLEQLFIQYLDVSAFSNDKLGLPEQDENYYPPSSFIRRQLQFTAIECLRYYASVNTITALHAFDCHGDKDLLSTVKKTLKKIENEVQYD